MDKSYSIDWHFKHEIEDYVAGRASDDAHETCVVERVGSACELIHSQTGCVVHCFRISADPRMHRAAGQGTCLLCHALNGDGMDMVGTKICH